MLHLDMIIGPENGLPEVQKPILVTNYNLNFQPDNVKSHKITLLDLLKYVELTMYKKSFYVIL